jgi:lipopolysaccharide biosynthesis glycosyltransferase
MDRKKFENLPTTWLSQEIYYRLDLPEILTNDKKIIYLDVDIVVNGNIGELIETEL